VNLKRIATETISLLSEMYGERVTELLKPQYKCRGVARGPGRLV